MSQKKREIKSCRVSSCDGEVHARKLCAAHLRRLHKFGSLKINIPIKRRIWGSTLAKTKEFRAWTQMRYRCNNPKAKDYHSYGGRGIAVCKRWDKFEKFIGDVGPRPSSKHSIERINNNRGYSPSNCKWILRSDQPKNRRPASQWRNWN